MPRWRGRNIVSATTGVVVSRGDGVLASGVELSRGRVDGDSRDASTRASTVEATWSHEDDIDASRRESGLY